MQEVQQKVIGGGVVVGDCPSELGLCFILYFSKGCASKLCYVQLELSVLLLASHNVTACNGDRCPFCCAVVFFKLQNCLCMLNDKSTAKDIRNVHT